MREWEKEAIQTLTRMTSAYANAQATIFVAILSTLVRNGTLSREVVKAEILDGLQEVAAFELAEAEAATDIDRQLEMEALQELVGAIKEGLFPAGQRPKTS